MLIGLKAPLVQGQHFPLTLHFEKAGNITTDVTVERSQPMPLHDHAAEAMPPGMKM
jgi:copper(I)-binding protein